ncbi:MFS transporter [Erythrobacter sp. NE805]|uniref:MFS transporter n=1 Tax=Erythrobacter sp. NE805 TaxID=3389875 RepID=UPI00396B280D
MATGDDGQAVIGASAMRKAFWRIIPLILVAYLFAYMDRVNVSFAAAEMNADLRFSATVYGLGSGLFFLGYALFEIPSNLMLVRFGARPWIARIMVTWGLLSAGMMFVETPMQFYVLRFLLGVAEAGFFPGVITYLSLWIPPCHRSRAVSRFYIAGPLASMVMGAMSGWLLSLDGTAGMHGWQWLFLAQGLPTVFVGLAVLALLPDRPEAVDWLAPEEKAWIAEELAREQRLIGKPASHNIFAVLANPRVLVFGVIGFTCIGSGIAFTLSAPLVLAKATGLDMAMIGYLTAVGGVLGTAAMLAIGNRADRSKDRFFYAALCAVIVAATLFAIMLVPAPGLVIAAYLVELTFVFSVSMLVASAWTEALPQREIAVGAAAINTISQIGAFVTPFAWGLATDATGSYAAGLALVGAMMATSAVLIWVLRGQLRAQAAALAAAQ